MPELVEGRKAGPKGTPQGSIGGEILRKSPIPLTSSVFKELAALFERREPGSFEIAIGEEIAEEKSRQEKRNDGRVTEEDPGVVDLAVDEPEGDKKGKAV